MKTKRKEHSEKRLQRNRFLLSNFTRFSLSFQSPFHLSLTVLVRYRPHNDIQSRMIYTTHLKALLPKNLTHKKRHTCTTLPSPYRDGTLYLASFKRTLERIILDVWSFILQFNTQCEPDMISRQDYFHFTRRYYGNHGCFLFLHLIICLNSVGILISFERDNKEDIFIKKNLFIIK